MTFSQLSTQWSDTEESHAHINELFRSMVDADSVLNWHRSYCEKGYGFGERAFHYLWKLICDEQEYGFSFCEFGVYKGQVLSLIKLLRPDATVHGVTPLTGEGGYADDNYEQDIRDLHEHFHLNMPGIIKGLSNEPWVIQAVKDLGTWDIIYVDGNHSYSGALADLENYAPLVKSGGYLLVDDAGHYLNMPWGMFRGHEPVSTALRDYMAGVGEQWEFIGNVVHLMCYKRK